MRNPSEIDVIRDRAKSAKMASQTAKKEFLEETLHYPEGSEEEVDKEWEEFTRLMAKLKENRRNRPHRYIRVERASLIPIAETRKAS